MAPCKLLKFTNFMLELSKCIFFLFIPIFDKKYFTYLGNWGCNSLLTFYLDKYDQKNKLIWLLTKIYHASPHECFLYRDLELNKYHTKSNFRKQIYKKNLYPVNSYKIRWRCHWI